MEPKRSKYDTNPLDANVSERAEKTWGQTQGADSSTEKVSGSPTQPIRSGDHEAVRGYSESEAPTRRIDAGMATSYPSVFVGPAQRPSATYEPPRVVSNIYQPPPVPPANIYQPPPVSVAYKPGSNKVSGLGIPEKWAVILPYLPFYLALVIAIVELLLVPRTETRVRFHAAQALALQMGITAVSTLLTLGGILSSRFTGAGLFSLITTVFLIISMIRVWKGNPHHIALLDEPRKWLDEKIKPRN
jgi:uncharacterized membrane protein